MPLEPIRARSFSDQVFRQLATEILSGAYQIGANLPSERELTAVLKVNRHVVREAVRRLEQVGLVKPQQGGGTRVTDFKRKAGLELLATMAEYAHVGDDAVGLWCAVFEMRSAIAADIARLCALRGGQALKDDLLAIVRRMKESPDEKQVLREDDRFWDRVVEGADNFAYRLAVNSLLKGAEIVGEAADQWLLEEIKRTDYRQPFAKAIAAGDAKRAEALVQQAMRASVDLWVALMRPGQRATRPAPHMRRRSAT
jgi:GntR family transcriptional repressor for pyruvate dehydrogenase complex